MPALVDATPPARTPAGTPGGHSPSTAPTPDARSNRGPDAPRKSNAAKSPTETDPTNRGTRRPRSAGRHCRAPHRRQHASSCGDGIAMLRLCRVGWGQPGSGVTPTRLRNDRGEPTHWPRPPCEPPGQIRSDVAASPGGSSHVHRRVGRRRCRRDRRRLARQARSPRTQRLGVQQRRRRRPRPLRVRRGPATEAHFGHNPRRPQAASSWQVPSPGECSGQTKRPKG